MKKKIRLFGIPMDLGQLKRGVDMGPGAVRYAGLAAQLSELGYDIEDTGNIETHVRESLANDNLLPEICRVCEIIYEKGKDSISRGHLPIFLGGDHSISMGSIAGITEKGDTGIIWIDAHGDFNTSKTSTTGNIHGMPLAALTGRGLPELVNIGKKGPKINPESVAIIGLRQLDYDEKKLIKKSGINAYTMRDIDELGINKVIRKALKDLSHISHVHVSLDLDSLDPMYAPGVGTPVSGGLTSREAHLIMEIIADSHNLSSMDIVEINPIIDRGNQTAKIAVELAVSLFGKKIL